MILREITGEREEESAVSSLRSFLEDESLLSSAWICRKRVIHQTIERHSRDVEVVARLASVLDPDARDDPAMIEWLEEIRDELRNASQAVAAFDRLLAREAVSPTGLLHHPRLTSRLLQVWLCLEIQLRPGERGPLAGLRDRLVHQADRHEIDLRDLEI